MKKQKTQTNRTKTYRLISAFDTRAAGFLPAGTHN
jgi:hypothetical protein